MAWFMPGSVNRTAAGNFRHWEPVAIYGKERAQVDSKVFPPIGAERNGHPCPKPDNVMLWLVSALSEPGELILDCMCGSGSTCVAAKKLGRRFIGIDISPEYCEIARKRLLAVETGVSVKEADMGQMALFSEAEE
jgi:DNA modification methylase